MIQAVLTMRPERAQARLDQKVQAIVRVSALIALDAAVVSYQSVVIDALTAGVSADEIVGVLLSVAPLVGRTRVTSAAPSIALALGYDVNAAFEGWNGADE